MKQKIPHTQQGKYIGKVMNWCDFLRIYGCYAGKYIYKSKVGIIIS